MNFICVHCEKPIRCSAILVDDKFLHATCKEEYNKAVIAKNWGPAFEEGGILHGLKPEDYKPSISDYWSL